MKKLQLFKTMLLLCALIVGSGTMWAAENDTHDFSQSLSQLLNNNASISPINISAQSYSVKEVIVTYRTTQSASKFSMAVTVGSTDFGSYSSEGKKSEGTTQSFSASSTQGAITITFTNNSGSGTGKGTLYVTNVRLVEGAAAPSSGEVTTTTIDASGITNTNKFVSTAAGSLSASVTYGTPAAAVPESSVTWSGDNDAVATINATTGAVTLVGAGTVTFTAEYEGVEDEYSSSSDTYEMTVTDEDPDLVTIWSENFSTYSKDNVPSGGTYSYACTNGGGTTKIYEENVAGGTSPELLIGKSSGTFTATVPLLTATYGYSGDLTLKFKSNAVGVKVTSGTTGVTIDGEATEGAGVTFDTKDTHKVTFKGVTTSTENIKIVFTTTTSSNVRIDDIILKGKQAELTFVATPSISPASGAIASGTEVTITCATDGATIYYTTNGDTPTSDSTPYDPEHKPTITSACTIKAIGIKAGLTNSSMASASYTIAEPCATPTFSVAAGEVTKGTTVTISCDTDDATIYYTTNGTTPTTSSSVYSSAITLNTNQTIKAIAAKDGMANSEVASATYTIIDYATLPFSYDGNGTGTLPTGLTVSGTGTYNSSPKIKLDDTGDYVIIKFNELPGELSYDIQGNSFSGGTFKVQTSTDGSSYSDLKSYTSLGSKTTETFNLASNVRYVKWIYTYKSSGNVALGAINLKKTCTITLASACTNGTKYFATYSNSKAFVVPDGLTVSCVGIDEGVLKVTNYETGDVVKANTGVMVSATSAGAKTVTVSSETGTELSGNLLKPSGDAGITASNMNVASTSFYRLTMHNGTQIGFWYGAADGAAFDLGANKAYLAVPDAMGARVLGYTFDDETTGVNEVKEVKEVNDNSWFDLQGRRVAQPTKGLYIVNGKKVVIK